VILTRKQFYNGEGIEAIASDIDGMTRWGYITTVVVRRTEDGTFWRGSYEEGATEVQVDSGGYDDDIEFIQVFPHERTHTAYLTVEEASAA